MRLIGRYFAVRSSAGMPVEIEILPDARVWLFGLGMPQSHALADLEISERLGEIPRQLRFPDGALCEVADNDALDLALDLAAYQAAEGWIHRLERRWNWALAGVVGVATATALALIFGIPALAGVVATAIPPNLDQQLGEHALTTLDGWILQPSTLPEADQANMRALFREVTADVPGDRQFRLELRASRKLGANALALPSAIVIVTDDLVLLADDDNELRAVMAHEVGHVVHRHTLRMLLQQSVTALFSLALLGDISATSSMVAALPGMLVAAKHSRKFESEADDFAYSWLDHHGISRRYFAAILANLRAQEQDNGGQFNYLSSHPRTDERIAKSDDPGN